MFALGYFLKNALEYVFVRAWTYEGKEYVVIPKMARLSNYLIDEAKYFDQNNFSIAESVKEDKIKLAGNQKDLLKAFLNEIRSEN